MMPCGSIKSTIAFAYASCDAVNSTISYFPATASKKWRANGRTSAQTCVANKFQHHMHTRQLSTYVHRFAIDFYREAVVESSQRLGPAVDECLIEV